MEDDLQENPLFQMFQNSEHFSNAADGKYVVVVPSKGALEMIKLNREFLLTHILKPSPFFVKEYVTLTDSIVAFEDSKLVIRNTVVPRTVKILCEELYYDDNFNSFKILKVQLPLIGRVSRAYHDSLTAAPGMPCLLIYLFIYLSIQRERERERERVAHFIYLISLSLSLSLSFFS